MLLPLLPRALANAVADIPEEIARPLLEAIGSLRTITDHVSAITQRSALLPVLTHDGVRWISHDAAGTVVVSVPNWTRAPSLVRELFLECSSKNTDAILFIDDDAPRIGGQVGVWSLAWLTRLLECIPTDALRTPEQLTWIDALVRHVIASHAPGHDERSAEVARWLAKRIGEDVLSSASDTAIREDLRAAWRKIFNALPIAWLVDAPIASQQGIVELASRGLIGEGLLPIPLGRRPGGIRTSHPEAERLDRALLELGNLLLAGHEGTSQSAQQARLLLAETLLSVREDRPLGEDLGTLPLLRAHKLPQERDEPWSVGQLRRYTERRRVFARTGADDGSGSAALESPSDPKRAVKDLAEALSDNVWIVDDTVASTARVPVPSPVELARRFSRRIRIDSPVAQRVGLLRRLKRDASKPFVRQAIRMLLTGRGCDPGKSRNSITFAARTTTGTRIAIRLAFCSVSWARRGARSRPSWFNRSRSRSSKIFTSRRLMLECCTGFWASALAELRTGHGSTGPKYSIFSNTSTQPPPMAARAGARCRFIAGLVASEEASTTERYAPSGRCASLRSLNPNPAARPRSRSG